MAKRFRFEEHLGTILDFNPRADVLAVSADKPTDVAITRKDGNLMLTTTHGFVGLRGIKATELNAKNIDFIPLEASNDALLKPVSRDSLPKRIRGVRIRTAKRMAKPQASDWVNALSHAVEHNQSDLVGEWADDRDLVGRDSLVL